MKWLPVPSVPRCCTWFEFLIAGCFSVIASNRATRARAPRPGEVPLVRAPYDPTLTDRTVAFYEDRVRRDDRGAISWAMLAGWYMRRSRETGDVRDVARAERAAPRSLCGGALLQGLHERLPVRRTPTLHVDALVDLGAHERADDQVEGCARMQP